MFPFSWMQWSFRYDTSAAKSYVQGSPDPSRSSSTADASHAEGHARNIPRWLKPYNASIPLLSANSKPATFLIVGKQSTGKSSVIEWLVDMPWNVVQSGTGTVAPTVYRTSRAEKFRIRVRESPSAQVREVERDCLQQVINDINNRIKKERETQKELSSFRKEPVDIWVEGPGLWSVVIYDMPGFVTTGEKGLIDRLAVEEIVREYGNDRNNIVLHVFRSNDDIDHVHSRKELHSFLGQDALPENERSPIIAVGTGLHLCHSDSVISKALNRLTNADPGIGGYSQVALVACGKVGASSSDAFADRCTEMAAMKDKDRELSSDLATRLPNRKDCFGFSRLKLLAGQWLVAKLQENVPRVSEQARTERHQQQQKALALEQELRSLSSGSELRIYSRGVAHVVQSLESAVEGHLPDLKGRTLQEELEALKKFLSGERLGGVPKECRDFLQQLGDFETNKDMKEAIEETENKDLRLGGGAACKRVLDLFESLVHKRCESEVRAGKEEAHNALHASKSSSEPNVVYAESILYRRALQKIVYPVTALLSFVFAEHLEHHWRTRALPSLPEAILGPIVPGFSTRLDHAFTAFLGAAVDRCLEDVERIIKTWMFRAPGWQRNICRAYQTAPRIPSTPSAADPLGTMLQVATGASPLAAFGAVANVVGAVTGGGGGANDIVQNVANVVGAVTGGGGGANEGRRGIWGAASELLGAGNMVIQGIQGVGRTVKKMTLKVRDGESVAEQVTEITVPRVSKSGDAGRVNGVEAEDEACSRSVQMATMSVTSILWEVFNMNSVNLFDAAACNPSTTSIKLSKDIKYTGRATFYTLEYTLKDNLDGVLHDFSKVLEQSREKRVANIRGLHANVAAELGRLDALVACLTELADELPNARPEDMDFS